MLTHLTRIKIHINDKAVTNRKIDVKVVDKEIFMHDLIRLIRKNNEKIEIDFDSISIPDEFWDEFTE
jgi:RNase P/RNase MRP subunit p30